MKNILTSILVFGFFSLLFLQKYYEEKINPNNRGGGGGSDSDGINGVNWW